MDAFSAVAKETGSHAVSMTRIVVLDLPGDFVAVNARSQVGIVLTNKELGEIGQWFQKNYGPKKPQKNEAPEPLILRRDLIHVSERTAGDKLWVQIEERRVLPEQHSRHCVGGRGAVLGPHGLRDKPPEPTRIVFTPKEASALGEEWAAKYGAVAKSSDTTHGVAPTRPNKNPEDIQVRPFAAAAD